MNTYKTTSLIEESELKKLNDNTQIFQYIHGLLNNYHGWRKDFLSILNSDSEIIQHNQSIRIKSLEKYRIENGYNLPKERDREMEFYVNLQESLEQLPFVIEVYETHLSKDLGAEEPYYSKTGNEFKEKFCEQFCSELSNEINYLYDSYIAKFKRDLSFFEETEKSAYLNSEIKRIRGSITNNNNPNFINFVKENIINNLEGCLKSYFYLNQIYGISNGIVFDSTMEPNKICLKPGRFLGVHPHKEMFSFYPVFRFKYVETDLINYLLDVKIYDFLSTCSLKTDVGNMSFQSILNPKQIEVLSSKINTFNLFRNQIDQKILNEILNCTLKKAIVTNSNRLLAYFFSRLEDNEFISIDWQSIIERNKLFTSKNGKYINAQDLSVAKSQSNKQGNPKGHEKIDLAIKEIKNIKT